MPRTINPLGIRKLDVMKLRRQCFKDAKEIAGARFDYWFCETPKWRNQPAPMTEVNVRRFAESLYAEAWEQGVRDGAKATRARVAEALERGTLVKP